MSSTPAPPNPKYGIGGVPDSDIRSQNPEYLTQSTPNLSINELNKIRVGWEGKKKLGEFCGCVSYLIPPRGVWDLDNWPYLGSLPQL